MPSLATSHDVSVGPNFVGALEGETGELSGLGVMLLAEASESW